VDQCASMVRLEMRHNQVALERMFADDETKDVKIALMNGNLRAHSVLLRASSDAFAGVLSHGVAADGEKTLNWGDQPIEVGRVFLRLLYTGALDKSDWEDPQASKPTLQGRWHMNGSAVADIIDSKVCWWHWQQGQWCGLHPDVLEIGDDGKVCKMRSGDVGRVSGDELTWSDGEIWLRKDQVPLYLLVGALALAKMYLVTHLVESLTGALKIRLNEDTFDEICVCAIKLDVMPLRFLCLRYAEQSRFIRSGIKVRASHPIERWDGEGVIPARSEGTVEERFCQTGDLEGLKMLQVEWHDYNYSSDPDEVMTQIQSIDAQHGRTKLSDMYSDGALSPEVLTELAGVWTAPTGTSKRQRLR
ncbi:unnamed protein product, partial [Prorocentrum cordatum]